MTKHDLDCTVGVLKIILQNCLFQLMPNAMGSLNVLFRFQVIVHIAQDQARGDVTGLFIEFILSKLIQIDILGLVH